MSPTAESSLCQTETKLNVYCEMEINFAFGAFPNVQRVSSENSGHFEGSLQLHCYWWVSTLMKYSSFLGVKNVRGVDTQNNENKDRGN